MPQELNYAFFIDLNDSFFTQFGKCYSMQMLSATASIPFKDCAELPALVDILSRKNNHHVLLQAAFSAKLYPAFIESLLLYLSQDTIPYPLNATELIFLDFNNATFTSAQLKNMEKDIHHLCQTLSGTNRYLLIAMTHADFYSNENKQQSAPFLADQLKKLLHHPQCRFLIFAQSKQEPLDDLFVSLTLNSPNEIDILTLLKQHRNELEHFHHVVIPDEILGYAYALAERYLSTENTLEKAMLLLDSSAARAGAAERNDNTQMTPVLTTAILMSVLSAWTKIPATQLPMNKFKQSEFTQGMQQRIFGQDAAITIICREIQQSHARLQQNTGPFSSLLFAGPDHSGKKTTAIALAEQLFKQTRLLYFAQSLTRTVHSLADIKLVRYLDQCYVSLKEAITQTPHGIFVFENIEDAHPHLLDDIDDIMNTGYLHTKEHHYSFRQAIIILTTTLGANHLIELERVFFNEHEKEDIDLMQLVMNNRKHDTISSSHHYTPQELADEIMPDIKAKLRTSLCQHLHIVPFLRLQRTAIEKIIHFKLRFLGRMLLTRYGVELSYAPEVMQFLANDAASKQTTTNTVVDIDKVLKPLYFVVEQAILNQTDNKNRPSQLFLQLNETGQLLRCDWIAVSTVRHHAT